MFWLILVEGGRGGGDSESASENTSIQVVFNLEDRLLSDLACNTLGSVYGC